VVKDIKFNIKTFGENRFEKDPYYFFRYYLISAIIFVILDALLYLFHFNPSVEFQLSPYVFVYPLIAFYGAGLSLIFIHNASHRTFPSSWINTICGELAGLHQLYGVVGWKTAHMLHHAYPDDPERDPHPPGHMSFSQYFFGMRKNFGPVLDRYFVQCWGESKKYLLFWRANNYLGLFGIFLRLLFWYLLLGPTLFFLLYVPSYFFFHLIGVVLNYYTHIPSPKADGTFEILNLNNTFFYKFMNFLFFGLFFHKNHHLKPGLFNPSRYDEEKKPPESR
jgi:fatty acid desaturase